MKRLLKITGYVAGILLVLLLLLLIVLQSPMAQTWATRKVVGMLDSVIDGDISVGKVHIRPFDAVVLKDVSIVDRAPYAADGIQPLDTFAKADYITVRIKPSTLLKQGVIDLTEAYVENGYFVLTNEPQGQGNLKRIFRQGDPKPKEPKEPDDKEILRVGRVEINGFRFRLRNYNSTASVPSDAINWADLDVSDIHLKGRKLRMHGKVVEGIADELSCREKSGMVIHHISGQARVGDGKTLIKDLRIRDRYSDLKLGEFQMTYDGMGAFSNFLEEVRLDGDIRSSRLNLETIGYFAPTLRRMSLVTNLDGEVHGYINDLHVKQLRFNTLDSGVSARVDGSLIGLPDATGMLLNYKIHGLSFTLAQLEKFIRGWAPGVRIGLDKYAKGETFTFNGTAVGPINRLAVNGDITSGVGALSTILDLRNVTDPKRPILIGGRLRTKDLDVGRIAGIEALGPVSLSTNLQATLAGSSPTVRIDTLSVDRLHALGYDYTGIAATGSYSGNAFDGRIICSDPNLNFLFQGIFTLSPKTRNAVYKFYANLGYADLNALNIDKRGTSRVSLRTSANFNRVDGNDLIGNIDIQDVQLTDMNGHHDIGDISIASHTSDDVSRIRLQSRFAEGTYIGTGFVTQFIQDLQDITVRKELPSLFRQEPREWAGNSYDIHFQTHDTQAILAFLKPGIYVADSTDIRLRIDDVGSLDATVQSRRIALNDKYLKDMKLTLDNEGGALNGVLTGSELNISPIRALSNRMILLADDDHVGVGFSYDNETEAANKGELLLSGQLGRSESDSLLLRAEVLPSGIYLNGDPWSIKRAGIGIYGPDIKVNGLTFDNDLQSLRIDGGYSSQRSDTLHVDLDNFDLGALNTFIGGGLDLQGRATGDVWLESPLKDRIGVLASLQVKEASIAGEALGTLDIGSTWDDARNGFDIRVRNLLNGGSNLQAQAFIPSSFKTVEGRLDLDRLDLTYAEPILSSLFSEMDGYLSGGIDFSGPMDALELSSRDLRFEDALLRVDFTNVAYYANGPLSLTSKGLTFDNVQLRDRYGSQGRLRGSIDWDHFKDMTLHLGIDMTQVEALDIAESAGLPFYGHLFATGKVGITGPLNAILLEVDADTAKEGDFHIPLDGTGTAGTSDLLTFKKPYQDLYIDPYDLMMNTYGPRQKKGNDLVVKLHVRPNTAVQAFVEIDKEAGNMLSGHGHGSIDVEVRPSTSGFTINGNYTLTDGLFHFSALDIARRDFTIEDGSTIRFGGDIMESDLDIKALYHTKASLGPLIADTTSVSTRRNVECGIGITEKLRNPRIAFSIEVPDLDPATQARVQDALNSEDKVQKQFISLLIAGGFLPDEQSGIVNNSTMLNSTVLEIMAGQLSNILQKLDIPIDLGLDYQQNSAGNDIFDVAVSTELFNNRVIVNGVIGNRQYSSGSSSQEVVGDLDIEIKLDKPGAFRLKLFSHSADQYTNYLDNLQRNGVGLTYQQEYNNFGEFLRYLFTRRKNRPVIEAVEPERNRIRIEKPDTENE